MRIGINLFPLTWRGGGMRQYALQLVPWLLRLSVHRLLLFHGLTGQPSVAALLRSLTPEERARVEVIEIDAEERVYREAHRFDVWFCPLNHFAPRLLDRPTLATLPDVQEQFFPEYFTPEQRASRHREYPFLAHAVTLLLTISDFSKRTICEHFGVSPDKVRVTYLGPNDDLARATAVWPDHLPPLPKLYVFYPANTYPHKNHDALLGAVARLRRRSLEVACVLTGHEVQPGINVRERIAAHGLQDAVLWLGHVPAPALRYLYEHAAALCFPSRFEGFGMPLVEAMLCGCPIVATAAASIPEIAGDAALLTEDDPDALAVALARLLCDRELRADLISRGQFRVRQFTAQAQAEATLQAIDEAVQRFHQPAPQAVPISYVVKPGRGRDALVRTLASLSYELNGPDEVLLLADERRLPASVRALCDNLGAARCVSPETWIDAVRHDVVCYLREGECLCEGASACGLQGFAETPGCEAVVGEALAMDRKGRLAGSRFAAAGSPEQLAAQLMPAAVVFWKRDTLRRHRDLLAQSGWWGRLLLSLPAARVRYRYRTFARTVIGRESRLRAWLRLPGQVVHLWRLAGACTPPLSRRLVLRSYFVRRLKEHKRRFLAMMDALPVALSTPLRASGARRLRAWLGER